MASSIKKAFDSTYTSIVEEMKENIVSGYLADLAKDLWEAFKDIEIVSRIEYNPLDMLGGSVSIYLTTMPGGYFLRVWYTQSNQCYLSGIFKQLSGTVTELIPGTFSEDGLIKIPDLDRFTDHFVTIVAKEMYNKKNMVVYLSNPPKITYMNDTQI